jgi:hypothetical protein
MLFLLIVLTFLKFVFDMGDGVCFLATSIDVLFHVVFEMLRSPNCYPFFMQVMGGLMFQHVRMGTTNNVSN